MTEEKPARGPLIESPVRIEARLEAEVTEAINKLADAGIDLGNDTVRPVGKALADLMVSVLDVLRGPFQRQRLRQVMGLAQLVKKLREEQGAQQRRALPARTQQRILEEASFVEDDDVRRLWAQLVVNAQAGMNLHDYLFEVLGKLNGDEARLLESAAADHNYLSREHAETERLVALGLLDEDFNVLVDVERSETTPGSGAHHMPSEFEANTTFEFMGYRLTGLGTALFDATRPHDPTAK